MKFKVGDLVTVRGWESMAAQYGINDQGTIIMPGSFTVEMREHCGKTYEVVTAKAGNYQLEGCKSQRGYIWYFTEAMLEDDIGRRQRPVQVKTKPVFGL